MGLASYEHSCDNMGRKGQAVYRPTRQKLRPDGEIDLSMARSYRLRSRRPRRRTRRARAIQKSIQQSIQLTALVLLFFLMAFWMLKTTVLSRTTGPLQSYSVVGGPSIDVDFIERVLVHYHSPAAGKGQALYDQGLKYGIDPAYALAFFMHESTFGTRGVATITHSLGNIRATRGYAQYDGYRWYRTWEQGFEDWYRLIANQYVGQWGLSTVDQIIPVYAPNTDHNDEAAYIQSVEHAVDTWHSGSVTL
jgi:Mannosyl-glycoprotein endo-beta-N-acetylglucosaminidase